MRLRLFTALAFIIGIYMMCDYFGLVWYIANNFSRPNQAWGFATEQFAALFVPVTRDELWEFGQFIVGMLILVLAFIILITPKTKNQRGH